MRKFNFMFSFFLSGIYILYSQASYSCQSFDSLSKDESEALQHPRDMKLILPIDIEECGEIADAIRDEYYKDATDEKHSETDSLFRKHFLSVCNKESEIERELRAQREKEYNNKLLISFIIAEQKIKDSVFAILSAPEMEEDKKKYEVLEKKYWPSVAILEFTKDIEHQSRALELLALIEDYLDDYERYLGRQVGVEASLRVFGYYLTKYNERAKSLSNSRQMDPNIHGLLQLCYKHTPIHPLTGIDDPENSLLHIAGKISEQLLKLNLWYLNNPTIIKNNFSFDYNLLSLFALGVRFLECTTYGLNDKYYDLFFMLKLKGFKGTKKPLLKDPLKFQYIWNHPCKPLQVRISQDGKLTVGFLKYIPLKRKGLLAEDKIGGDPSNELFKIGTPDIPDLKKQSEKNLCLPTVRTKLFGSENNPSPVNYLIPAGFDKNRISQEFWLEDIEPDEKKELMAEAHRILQPANMNFVSVDKYVLDLFNKKPKHDKKNKEISPNLQKSEKKNKKNQKK